MTGYEVRLRPHATLWRMIMFGWMPMLLGLAGLAAVGLIETTWPAIADSPALRWLPLLVIAIGFPLAYLRWGRGPKLTIADGTLTLAAHRAPLASLAPRVEEYVYDLHGRFPGRYCQPVLVLTLPAGEQRILHRGGGGRTPDKPRSRNRPHYELNTANWDALTHALAVSGDRLGMPVKSS